MEQHPIPQNVSSYQFKLVGDMTLKQFFQLAGGLLAAFIFYSSPLLSIIKWPFAILSAVLGVALAFLPLEERPLEKWIFAFFKAIYTPSMFFWQKGEVLPKFFQDEGTAAPQVASSPQQEAALKEYLSGAGSKGGVLGKLDEAEKGFLATLTAILSGGTTPTIDTQQPTPAESKPDMIIPQTIPIKVTPAGAPHLVVEEKPLAPSVDGHQITTNQVAPIIAGDEIISTKQAMFSIDAAPPNPPTIPNVVVGQVVDQDRKIIEGAIMEIKDSAGRPIRAIRSNKVGHFITVTPLDPGRYDIITDKEGFEFDPVGFEAAGSLIPPILVQGKKIGTQTGVPAIQ
jgi:hypothetical protein